MIKVLRVSRVQTVSEGVSGAKLPKEPGANGSDLSARVWSDSFAVCSPRVIEFISIEYTRGD